jgi:hypothetical protein
LLRCSPIGWTSYKHYDSGRYLLLRSKTGIER